MNLVEIIANVRSGLVQVLLEKNGQTIATGSGFLVKGGLITNSHVLRIPSIDAILFKPSDTDSSNPANYIRLLPDHCYKQITAESFESEKDYAFIKLEEPEFDGKYRFDFAPNCDVKVGEKVIFLGFPFGTMQLTAHVGYISSTFLRHGNTKVFQLDGSVNGGNSGGPILNLDGHVVGIVTRAVTGLIEDQFNALLNALRSNQEALQASRGIMSIGAIDPIEALRASQAAMEQIARDLHRSANVGIGYAYSVEYIKDHIANNQ